MKRISLILLFLTPIFVWCRGQNLSVEVDSLTGKYPTNINVYQDQSYSVKGFFDVAQTRDNDIEKLFRNIEYWTTRNEIALQYYVFDTICYSNRSWSEIGQIRTNSDMKGAYNVYSTAITSLASLIGDNDVAILITDGVPSLAPASNSLQHLKKEKSDIEKAIKEYLYKDKENNTVSLFRYLAAYDGNYHSSDGSFDAKRWQGNRNLYALVFAKKQHLKTIDVLMNGKYLKEDGDKFGVLKLSPKIDEYIKKITHTELRNEKGMATFDIIIEFHEPISTDIIEGVLDATGKPIPGNYFDVKTTTDNSELKISFEIPIGNLVKDGRTKYTIVAKNYMEKTRKEFDDLSIGGDDKEIHELNKLKNDAGFHHKTFRLNYIVDAIVNTQRPRIENSMNNPQYGLEIGFSVLSESSWVTFFEPLFGAIPPPATLKALNEDFLVAIPVQLFLFRWLTPIGIACLVFFLFLNRKGMRFTNPQQQKLIWRGGLILNLLIVSIAVCIVMFKEYGASGETLTTAYQLKHLIYNPVFSLLLYIILSLILTRRKFCTACDNPIPF